MVTPRANDGKGARTVRARRRAPSPKVLSILRNLKGHLEGRFGDGIRKVILYGSQARGTAHEGSDVDVVVLVGDEMDPREVERSLDDLLWDVMMDHDELVTVIAMREEKFANESSPFILNVKDDGVVI